jgi:hypothetical protein
MTNLKTRLSIACILAWSKNINRRTSVNLARTLAIISNSMNEDIGSRGVYLSIAEDGDVIGDGGVMLSMSGRWRARSSWRRICWDVAPPDLDRRRPVVKVGSSHAKSASQKPYLSSSGAGLEGRGFWRLALPNVGARRWSGWRDYGGSIVMRREKH